MKKEWKRLQDAEKTEKDWSENIVSYAGGSRGNYTGTEQWSTPGGLQDDEKACNQWLSMLECEQSEDKVGEDNCECQKYISM